jgi:hypothetical protein
LIDKETAALFPQSGCHRTALHVASFFVVTLDHDAKSRPGGLSRRHGAVWQAIA